MSTNKSNSRIFSVLLVAVSLLALTFSAIGVTPVYAAATLTVTNINDSGIGSLRQAVIDAASGDTIAFDTSLSDETITLTSTLTLSKDVTIDGSGLDSQITISGNNAVRVIEVNGIQFTLKNLTIADGASIGANGYTGSAGQNGGSAGSGQGGGIFINGGIVTIINSTFRGNRATGGNGGGGGTSIQASCYWNGYYWSCGGGYLAGTGGTGGSAWGGGIYVSGGALYVTNSTFVGNIARGGTGGSGGAGTSTYSCGSSCGKQGYAGGSGGGGNLGYGGAIYNPGGSVYITNSTFSDNSAIGGAGGNAGANMGNGWGNGGEGGNGFGGGLYNTAYTQFSSSTLSENKATGGSGGSGAANGVSGIGYGGAIYRSGGFVAIKNTIVANSSAGGNCYGGVTSYGYNLDSGTTCALANLGDITNTNPQLGGFGENSGVTFTYALLPGSPAIDHGNPSGCTDQNYMPISSDQRGRSRAYNSTCDIGAYEYAPLTLSVNKLADTNDDSCDGSDCSLREAIAAAGPDDSINFAAELTGTINLGSLLAIDKSLTIDGPGSNIITVSGENATRVFHINTGAIPGTININNLTIANGYAGSDASGIANANSIVNIDGVIFTNNNAANGGAIANNATMNISNSTFSNNSSSNGGGINNFSGATLFITNSTFSSNSATGNGGGLYNTGTATVTSSSLINNSATNDGGGIRNHGSLTVTDSTLQNNSANDGGAIDNLGESATLMLIDSTLSGNTANYGGGIRAVQQATVTFESSIVTGNNATQQGGGIYNSTGTLTISQSTISGNSTSLSSGGGGGIYTDSGTVILNHSNVNSNQARYGGGIMNYFSVMTLNNSTVTDNSAVQYGGGIYNNADTATAATLNLNNSTVSDNTSTGPGGGIANIAATVTLSNSIVNSNSAGAGNLSIDGGGLYCSFSGTLNVIRSLFSGNDAGGSGGAMLVDNGCIALIANSTLTGNSAYAHGGALFNNASVTMTNSTIAENILTSSGTKYGSGIYTHMGGSTTVLKNTILANNSGGETCTTYTGTLTDGGHNLQYPGTSCGGSIPATDPLLGTLQDNGGPTQTMAIQPGSPAIDAGDNDICADKPVNNIDQRGFLRPVDGDQNYSVICDIGAFEYHPMPEIVVEGPGSANIADGGTYNLGMTMVGTPLVQTITVRNTGTAALTLLTNPPTTTGNFTVTSFGSASLAAGASTTFDLTCNATSSGSPVSGTVSFNNNDSDENPFNFTVNCTVASTGNLIVNSILDTNDGICDSDNCTLREAINAANSLVGADTITFNVSGTITLGSQLPNITSDVIINGKGQTVAISGNNSVRVFYLASTGNLTLDTITVKNGNAGTGYGGGMYNDASSPTLINVTFSNNLAKRGGGMYNDASSPTLINVTFSGNSTGGGDGNDGGGMSNWNGSSPTLTNVTFSGNSASGGGGMFNNASSPTLMNVTFSGNLASWGGGMMDDWNSNPKLTNVTFSGNSAGYGGGMVNYHSSTARLAATILKNGTNGANCVGGVGGGVTDNGYNLSDDGSCSFSGMGSQNSATLNLGALADNGGSTQTHLPGAGSVAIDLIPNGTTISNNGVSYTCNKNGEPLDIDQRGRPRPATVGGGCDAGAVEVVEIPPAEPTLTSPANGLTMTINTPDFDWGDVSGAKQYQIQADDNADFSSPEINTTTTISAYTPTTAMTNGAYNWRVRAGNGEWSVYSSSWTLTVAVPPAVPTLLTPTSSSTTTDNTPSFDWGDVAGTTQYQIQVDDNSNFTSPEIDTTTTSSTHTPTLALTNGTYYWHVRAGNGVWSDYSGSWILTVAVPPAIPTLLTPTNSSTTSDNTPSFDWGDVAGTTQYQIQVDDNSNFTSPEIDTTTTSSTHTPSLALANGTYYWHVRAGNGVWSDYSGSWTVTVAVPPAVPTLLTPTSSSTTTDNTPSFDWGDMTGATQYQIQVDDNSNFTSPEIDTIITSSTYTPATVLADDTYYWHVRSSNGVWSDYSGPWTLIIKMPLIVTTTADELNTNGMCSLREAIINANNDNQSGSVDCTAGSEADTITFSLSGTITLDSQLPDITTEMTIDGTGQTVAVSGNNSVRVFYVASTGNLTLDTITVKNGNAGTGYGGGMYNDASSPTLINVTFSNNLAKRGGGMYNNASSPTLMNVTFSGNSTGGGDGNDGGGMSNWNSSSPTLTNVTFSGNSASGGGGMFNDASNPTLMNVTFSGNLASWGGGMMNNHNSSMKLTNVTFSGNSAGWGSGMVNYNSSTARLAATILKNGANSVNCVGGGVTDNGYNLSDDESCSFSGTGSQNSATLNLGALADNGGSTQTHLPGAGSAAIDLIPNGTTISNNGVSYTCNQNGEPLDIDQRGRPRPATVGGGCDAGAVEVVEAPPAVPTLTSPANGLAMTDTTPDFDWGDISGATQYQIQADDNVDFSSPEINTTTTISAYTPTTAMTNGAYNWRVRAGNDEWSAYSVTFVLTVLSTNANLSDLVFSTGALTPAFDSATTTYTQSVANATTSLIVTPTVADATATVTVNGVTVVSGIASGSISLSVGDNIITTEVTAQDGTTIKTYTVMVTRAPAYTSVYKLFLPLLLR